MSGGAKRETTQSAAVVSLDTTAERSTKSANANTDVAASESAKANEGEEVSEEEVYDALLGASLSDDVVGRAAQLALERLGQSSNHKLVQRAVDLLSQHAKILAEERVPDNVARRAALFRLLSSVVGNYVAPPQVDGKEAAQHSGAKVVDVTDFLIEQVVNDIEWEQSAADEDVAPELEALREAAEQLLVQVCFIGLFSYM